MKNKDGMTRDEVKDAVFYLRLKGLPESEYQAKAEAMCEGAPWELRDLERELLELCVDRIPPRGKIRTQAKN